MNIIKKNITLVIGISIPILMVILVAGSVYLPGLFIKPQYNFLYSSGDQYYYGQEQYTVQLGKIVKSQISSNTADSYSLTQSVAKLYIYDVTTKTNKEITYAEAQLLTLDSSVKSPDGFEISYGNSGGGLLPLYYSSGSNYNTRYLKGHNVSNKLNLQVNNNTYYNFHFIGWIK